MRPRSIRTTRAPTRRSSSSATTTTSSAISRCRAPGIRRSTALLVVNHEYTNEELMFPGLGRQDIKIVTFAGMTKELVDIEMAAHGGSVLEIKRDRVNGASSTAPNMRGGSMPIRRSGSPARPPGPPAKDRAPIPPVERCIGMLNNCAGGVTPWGTWLSCEENFHGYFWGNVAADDPRRRATTSATASPATGMPGAISRPL